MQSPGPDGAMGARHPETFELAGQRPRPRAGRVDDEQLLRAPLSKDMRLVRPGSAYCTGRMLAMRSVECALQPELERAPTDAGPCWSNFASN